MTDLGPFSRDTEGVMSPICCIHDWRRRPVILKVWCHRSAVFMTDADGQAVEWCPENWSVKQIPEVTVIVRSG